MRLLGEQERSHKARQPHKCDLGTNCTIEPGDTYFVGVTLPGEGRYAIGGGDYESVDWPFGVQKSCVHHYNEAMSGEW